LITGGSGGIGKACGRKLAQLGYDVVLTARREEPLRAAADKMGARYIVADATDPEKFAPAIEAAGEIDLLVHASGILGGTYARKQTFEQWRATMSANLDSCFVVTSAALPRMKAGSRFVFVSSSAAHEPMRARTAYCASKAGMNAFAGALSLEVDRDGINVHVVTPGPVETTCSRTCRSRCMRSGRPTSPRRWHGWTPSIRPLTCRRSGCTPSHVARRLGIRWCRWRSSAARAGSAEYR
jgi:NAD(P)-dependent dehydrogenase (short-subunit alcohol dehydrogenase family)